MKKVLFYLISFVLVFCGTAGAVLLSSWAENDELSNKYSAPTKEEDIALMSMVENVLSANNFYCNFKLVSNDDKTNINGIGYFNNADKCAKIEIQGKLLDNNTNLNFYYKNNYFYLSYGDVKIKTNSEDFISSIKEIIGYISSSELASGLDISSFTNILTGIETTKEQNGTTIKINLDSVGIATIFINNDNFPAKISIELYNINNVDYTLTANLNSEKTEKIYISNINSYIDLSEKFAYIKPIINTIKNTPIKISGLLKICEMEVTTNIIIDNKFNIQANFTKGNISFSTYILDDGIGIDVLGTYYKIGYDELITLFKENYNISSANDLFSTNNTSINPNIISLSIENELLSSINLNSNILKGTLYVTTNLTDNTIEEPTENLKSLSDLKTLIETYSNLISENYSIDLNGSIGGKLLNGKIYFNITSKLNDICFIGTLNNIQANIYRKGNYYYIDINGYKAKFYFTSINKMYTTIKSLTNIEEFDLNSAITDIFKNITIKSFTPEKLSISYNNSSFTIKHKTNLYTAYLNNIKINNTTLYITASIKTNNDYKSYIDTLNTTEYANLTDYTDLLLATINTIGNKSITAIGNLSFSIDTYNFYNIGITFKSYYNSKNKFCFKTTFTNLPTSMTISDCNSMAYKNHYSELIYDGKNITLNRYATIKITNIKTIIYSNTKSLSEFSLSDILQALGIKQTYSTSIKNDNTYSNADISNMFNAISSKQNELITSLKTSGISSYLSDLDISIKFTDKIENLTANINFSKLFKIGLNLMIG